MSISLRMLALLCLLVVGTGCRDQAPEASLSVTHTVQLPQLPTIQLQQPANRTTVATSTLTIEGFSNMPEIFAEKNSFPVTDGRFSFPISLHSGWNTITLEAGNGRTTTTLPLRIQRLQTQP